MNNFYIVTNVTKDKSLETTDYIEKYLTEHGRHVTVMVRGGIEKGMQEDKHLLQIPPETDCILVLGGDGTLLQTARDTVGLGIPLLGINLGTLGFLAEVEKSGITDALDHLMQDSYEIMDRMLLSGSVIRDGKELLKAHALNDIVVNRCGHLMVLNYEVLVNGQLLCHYKADGMILASPTGSTGYNMSAGGPIVEPGARLMVMTPICPHTLNTRSIILSPEDQVEMVIAEGRDGQAQQAEVNFDGGQAQILTTGDRIRVHQSEQVVRLLHINKVSFLQMLHKKMGEG